MRLVVGLSDTLDKPDLGAGPEMRRGLGWVGLFQTRRVAGWAGPEPSLRHVRQAWPPGGHAFQDKKAIFQ